MKILSVDPGASGGIAWYDRDGNVHCLAMPSTEGDVLDTLREIRATCDVQTAYVEEVGGYIGGNPAPGSAMFNFGRGFGFLLGCLMAMGVRVELVRPQKWQKQLGIGNSKSAGSKTLWKNKLKSLAQRRFPNVSITLKTCDALLILDYASKPITEEVE